MKTIYLVSSGDYSDYSVWCAFETRELADEYVARVTAIHPESYEHPFVEDRQMWDVLPAVTRDEYGVLRPPR